VATPWQRSTAWLEVEFFAYGVSLAVFFSQFQLSHVDSNLMINTHHGGKVTIYVAKNVMKLTVNFLFREK
jgi:hypothetical protein